MKLRYIIFSWDIILALVSTVIASFYFYFWINNEFAIVVYEIGISVLSIIFSVFFAALAIIISSSDDEFVKFLDETGDYKSIISSFKFSLSLLFIALLYSIILTVISSYFKTLGHINQQFYFLTIFIFLFSYSLLATFISTFDAIKYSSFRTEYLKIKKPVK
jgi:hypothetical protein